MIVYTTAERDKDLAGIIDLQKRNLPANLGEDEIKSQGFVTVVHSTDDLRKMNAIEPNIIAKKNDTVIAYLLAMTAASKKDIPVLIPMFDMFEKIQLHNKPVSKYNYLVVGQVCVDKAYRGQGVLDDCYTAYRDHFRNKYDFAITEIAAKNLRSINAHKRIGFYEILKYAAPDKEEWSIVIWEWKE